MKTGGGGGKGRLLAVVFAAALAATHAAAQPAETVTFSPGSATFTDSVSVTLSGASPGQVIRYVVASGSGAVAAEVTSSSPLYTSPITVANTALIRAAVFASAEATTGGRATHGYYLKLAEDVRGLRSQLPVLVLDVLGFGALEKDEINHPSWLFGFTGNPTTPSTFEAAAALSTPLEATVRGSSSAEFPKKGYNVRLRDPAGRSRAAALFDLPAYERFAFVAPWSFDPTFFNNAFMYELSNRIGRWAPRTKLVEFFFNTTGDELSAGDYGGIYVITDRIRAEPGRVAIERLAASDNTEPNITGGYLFQFDPPGSGDVSWRTTRGVPEQEPSEIVLVEPASDSVTPAQRDYIRDYVQRLEDALHADLATGFAQRTHLDFIDRGSWVDHHILNVLASNPDALHRSAYFTKPRNGRLQAGPLWDFDRALGGFWDERTAVVDTWSGLNATVDVWHTGWWAILAQDPDFVQEWIDRWQSLRQAELATPALHALAQQLADTVGVVAAARDVARWPDSASPYGSYTAQIEHLKNWLAQRTAWIDGQFVAPPTVVAAGQSLVFTPPAGAAIAYTTDGTDPRASGGSLAPDAQLHNGPLTVPATTNIRARSYNPAPREQFPSSPWSTLAQSVQVSAALTQGRIVNLSSKAHLSGAEESLIMGFVVRDASSKRLLVRAAGPSLAAFGETQTLADPQLLIRSGAGALLAQNDDWPVSASAAEMPLLAQSVGAFPFAAGSADAAAVFSAPSGNFTAAILPSTSTGGTVLGELYELDAAGRTANVSIRARTTPEHPLVAGFVVSGGTNRVLIRAVGPTLRQFGVEDSAGDPALLIRSEGTIIATNDSWLAGADAMAVEESSAKVGAFPLAAGSQDAALVLNLPAGSYTAEVTPAGSGGTILLEIYDVP